MNLIAPASNSIRVERNSSRVMENKVSLLLGIIFSALLVLFKANEIKYMVLQKAIDSCC